MPAFEYKGIIGEKNTYTDGVIEAINEDEAAFRLREQKIIIISLAKSKKKSSSDNTKKKKNSDGEGLLSKIPFLGGGSVKPQEVMLFSKKIATMIRAGLPIIDSLEMTENQVVDKKMKTIISGIVADLRGGFELSQCFAKHPKVFDNIYINMIKAGEASGKLDIFFDKLVEILEKRQKLKQQIKSALMYPVIIMCIALLITVFLLWKVVPVFEEMYGGMGVDLPGPTKAIIAASEFIQGSGGLITLICIIGFVLLFRFMMGSSPGFKRSIDGLSLKLPIFGPVIAQSTVSRIALIKANLFAAGVDVLEILDIATSSTSNTLYIEALERVKRGVFSGEDMSKLCANEKMFPQTYSQLIAVGERTGNLEEMFTSIANYYEEEFDNIVGNISTMIEPLSMVIIGGIVGVLLIAMYLPIFNAGSAIG